MRKSDAHLDIAEFQELGLLQEVNRRFFHPIGLALAVRSPDPGDEDQEWQLAYIIDSRDDPEGFIFAKLDVKEAAIKAAYYDAEVKKRLHARNALFAKQGFTVPLDWTGQQSVHTLGGDFGLDDES